MLTPFSSDLCRTEKYNVGEKMISWLGVRYGPMFVIVLVLFAAGWSGADPVTFLIMPHPDTFISMWGCTFAIPLLVIIGILADKYGRWRFLALLAIIAVFIEGLFASFMVTMTYSVYFNVKFVTVAITGLALLMAYESVPLKYRLPVLVGMSIPPALGSVLCDVVGYSVDVLNFDHEGMAELDFATKDRVVLLIKQVIGGALMLASFMAIVIVLRTQVGLWRIFKEASSKLYMTMLAQKGKQDTGFYDIPCPVPVTRTEFVINISNDTVRDSRWEIARAARGPLVLLLTLAIAEGLSFSSLNMYEVVMAELVFSNDIWGNAPRVTTTVMMIIASMIYIVLWYFYRDVRYVVFAGLILCAISSFMALAAPVEVVLDAIIDHEKDRVDTTVFTVGYILASAGLSCASASLRLFVLDLMPTKMRATGILTWLAVVNFSSDLIPLLGRAGWFGPGAEIFSAFFIGVSSILGLAAVYTTNWFKHSLVCRDPELDAQWLIKELSPANKFTYTSFP